MSRQLRAILFPILLMCSPLSAWSGLQQSPTPAKETKANTEKSASSSSQSTDGKKPEKDPAHKWHIRLGAITVGASYSHFSNGYFGYPNGFYPYRYGYTPYFWEPLWEPYSTLYYPGYSSGFQADVGKGEVRLIANTGKAEVFVDGAYAGTAQNLKNFWLDPGAYDLSVMAENCAPFHKRIYVLSGKKLKVTATLAPQKPEEVKP